MPTTIPTRIESLTKKYLTRSVASTLVVRIFEPAALVNPCSESIHLSCTFRMSGFGLWRENDEIIIDGRDIGTPHTMFTPLYLHRHSAFSMRESLFAHRLLPMAPTKRS